MSDVHDSYPGDDQRFLSTRAPTVTPVAFVADAPIEPQAPPVTQTGPIGWVRENLFSGWLNTLLTLGSIAVILWIVPAIWTWAVSHAIWYADSLEECRALVDS